jgi:hypothetical protein
MRTGASSCASSWTFSGPGARAGRGAAAGTDHARARAPHRPSKKETFCLAFTSAGPAALSTARRFYDSLKPRSTVWVNYPHLHEALVVAVADADERIELPGGAARHTSSNERLLFRQEAAGAQTRALKGAKVVGWVEGGQGQG